MAFLSIQHVLTWILLVSAVSTDPGFTQALNKMQREDPNIHVTDDAVVIEVSGHVRHKRQVWLTRVAGVLRPARPALPHAPCYTASGQLGKCASFRECYPYFKVPSVATYGPWLFGSYDTCSYFNDQVKQPDVFQTLGVCCVSPITIETGDLGSGGPPQIAPVDETPAARPALGSWPPPLPPLPTHPPDHSAPTHPPGFGIPEFPTTTKLPTTWATKPSLTTSNPQKPTYPTTLTTDANQVMSDHPTCGAKNGYQDQERIVGGHNADQNEWPWIAGLFNAGRQFCGGSLIDEVHILTAAHCVASMTSTDVARVTVKLGDHDIRTNSEIRHIEKRVRRVVRHRGFDMRTLYNDVAVLTMDSPVHFTHQVRPICLPYGNAHYGGTTATVIGWGSLRESGPQPGVLQEVSIPIWTNAECRQKYGAAAPGGIVEHMICAGRAMKDSCSGDSGGPMMVGEGGRWVQVGVVSWGIGCGKGQYPGVYSRVSYFMPWIQKNTK